MENRLQKLTEKLYNEGLSKGKQEADRVLEQAHIEAKECIDKATLQAQQIIEDARRQAEELKKNTATEVALAARQSIGAVKEQIQNVITSNIIDNAVTRANSDSDFVKNLIMEIARNWSSEKNIALDVMLSANAKEEFIASVRNALSQELGQDIEVRTGALKSGFRISPKDGGFFVSFTDEDFQTLISEYLRPQIADMIFGK
jgi:V/A-type H+-transporting ATPase subunit E